jgi:hypothetical protein
MGRTQVLLMAEADGPNWTHVRIAEAFFCRVQTVAKIRQRLVEQGFRETLTGWREVAVRETKTKVDWAMEMARNLEGRYTDCDKAMLVCDNVNTHTKGAFYEVFEPERVRRIEFRHTPKHGSWLNIAENEPSSLTRQCVSGRRFADVRSLAREASVWATDVNSTQLAVDWHMKVDDARTKLKSIYPKIKL